MHNFICPVCDSLDIEIFIEIRQLPVCCNLLYETRKEAIHAPMSDLKLGSCKKCGHVYNYAFKPDLMDYAQDYENAVHFSPRFKTYAQELAYRLVEQYGLFNKDIIEIGCGDGYFLKLLCEIGKNRGVGFDPSRSAKKYSETFGSSITYINDFYSSSHLRSKADFISCRHVLEHLQFPSDFIHSVRDGIGNRFDTVVFFEVPNALYTLIDLGIWDLIYEHCNYFNSNSLRELFLFHGFEVIDLRDEFEGQFLSIEAKPVNRKIDVSIDHSAEVECISDYVNTFAADYNKTLNDWNMKIDHMKKRGSKAVVWGAGSKGITFLNMLNKKSQIDYLVDISPRKQGKYVPGTGQKIISPEDLESYRPDIVIVMNPIYLKEIQEMINQMNLTSQLISVQR